MLLHARVVTILLLRKDQIISWNNFPAFRRAIFFLEKNFFVFKEQFILFDYLFNLPFAFPLVPLILPHFLSSCVHTKLPESISLML